MGRYKAAIVAVPTNEPSTYPDKRSLGELAFRQGQAPRLLVNEKRSTAGNHENISQ